jgi:hypothetical protein
MLKKTIGNYDRRRDSRTGGGGFENVGRVYEINSFFSKNFKKLF